MATYKVLQDIEAEDKFLGPLTLKQFIFGSITIVCLYLGFLFLTKGLWPIVIFLAPIAFVSGFLAFPWGRDQPTETWLLAKLRYYFKPRRRVWNQTGIQELVKINVPKKVLLYTGNNLSQAEVQNRLQALAETVDTRGWATKNVSSNIYNNPNTNISMGDSSDRLAPATTLPDTGLNLDADDGNDIFSNSKVQALESQLQNSASERKNSIKSKVLKQETNESNWFMKESEKVPEGYTKFTTAPLVSDTSDYSLSNQFRGSAGPETEADKAMLEDIHRSKKLEEQSFHNHKVINPNNNIMPSNQAPLPVTPPANPATIELARNNDRNIDSIAREINQIHSNEDQDEVSVSLH